MRVPRGHRLVTLAPSHIWLKAASIQEVEVEDLAAKGKLVDLVAQVEC